MKNSKIIILIVLGFCLNTSYAQNKPTNLDIKQLSVGGITYTTSIKEVKNKMGKPLLHKEFDMGSLDADTEGKLDIFYFDGLTIDFFKPDYLKETIMREIVIKNNKHTLTIGEKNIRVGDDLKQIEKILPYEYQSFITQNPEIKSDKKYRILGGYLTYGRFEPTNILFWVENQKIIEISIGFPCPGGA